MTEPKQYASKYYERNREAKIAQQMEYHRTHREKYLAYMREYNKQYWLKNRPPPKPKKMKESKPPKEPKPSKVPKEKKPPKEKPLKEKPPKKNEWFVVPEPVYPMKMEKGNFTLIFD